MSYVYRFKCITDTSLRYETRTYEQGPPTFNPDDPGDPVDPTTLFIDKVIDSQVQAMNEYVQSLAGETTLLTGSASWDSGLTFKITALTYLIRGTYKTAASTNVTLSTAHVTYDRIDIIVADDTGTVSVLTGTPAASPGSPIISDNQVVVRVVTVSAGASVPNIATENLYIENAGSGGGEWDWSENTSNVELKLASTLNPYDGSAAIEAVNATNGDILTATALSAFDTSNVTLLEFAIRPKAAFPGTRRIKFTFYYNNVKNGQTYALDEGDLGFKSSNIAYQVISVPKGSFVLTDNRVDKLTIEVAGSGNPIGFFLDRIRFQTGDVATVNTHLSDYNNPHKVTKAQVGLGNVANTYNNSSASNPTASNDNTQGYTVGSRWINTITNKEFICTNNTTAGAIWVETTVASAAGVSSAFNAYSSINQPIGDAFTSMDLHIQRITSSDFTHVLTTSEITINTTDTFLVIGTCAIDVTAGESRTQSECRWQINTGSGWVPIAGTFGQEYHREILEGGGTMTMPFVRAFTAGDKIRMQARRSSGTNTIVFKASGCSVNIIKMKGEQGPQGIAGTNGTDGADGAPGAGSSVIIKDEGSNVVNTPHNAINFIGDTITVTDAGSGIANVTLTAPVPIFGSEFQDWASVGLFTNNTTTFLSKGGFPKTTTSVPAGRYRVGWSYGWSHQNATNDFRARIQFDGVTYMEHQQEPKDAAADDGEKPAVGSGTDQMHRASGFFYITTVSTGTHTIDLQISSNVASIISSVFDVRVEFWRVA